MGRLDGKFAFVTGAGGGIGRSICARFLAEGAFVAAVDIDANAARDAVEHGAKGRTLALACDVGDSRSVADAVAQTAAAFGRINVLCNLAGGSTPRDGPVTEAPEEEFWRAIRLDLFGTFACCKHGVPQLIAAGGGSVINMASMVALMAVPGRDCYTAAKGGVVTLTRSMALEYAPHKVRVNAIAPGITLTPRVQASVEGAGRDSAHVARHHLGLNEAIDVAHLAVYLASDESLRVTGQVMAVDSGVTVG